MRSSIGETLERLVLLQIGAAAATRDRVEETVERLIDQGRIQREEGRTVVDDVMTSARQRSSGARSMVDASVQQGMRSAGLPTREDYEDMVFRVEQLEHRVRMLEGGSPAAGVSDSPASTPGRPTTSSEGPASVAATETGPRSGSAPTTPSPGGVTGTPGASGAREPNHD